MVPDADGGLIITGTILPPCVPGAAGRVCTCVLQTADARDFAEHPDLQHRCEQFTCSEAEELCTQLAGLPLCFEHGDGADSRPALIVGSVNRAWVGPNHEVQIEALVRASTGLEKTVRDGILSKNLSGLSLSHEYCVSLGQDKDGESILITKKQPKEVSVCEKGRRPSTGLTGVERVVSSGIKACSYTHGSDETCISLRVIGTGKFMASDATVVDAAPEAESMEVNDVAAPVSVEPEQEASKQKEHGRERDVTGKFKKKEQAAAPAPAPAPAPPASDVAQMNRDDLAAFAAKITQEASSAMEKMRQQMDANATELNELRAMRQQQVDLEEKKKAEELNTRLQELASSGFNKPELLESLRGMAAKHPDTAMMLMQVGGNHTSLYIRRV